MEEIDTKELYERNIVVDLTRFVMSILVVSIHIRPFDGELGFIVQNIIARIADPMFFILTSYFFFNKIKKQGLKFSVLLSYLKRIGILYMISMLVYCSYIVKSYSNGSVIINLYYFFKDILFSGPRGAGQLWFLPATQLSIILCFICAKYLNNFISLIISFILYIPSIINTEYVFLYSKIPFINFFSNAIYRVFGKYYNGLTFGFFFCVIGMLFSFEVIKYNKKKNAIVLFIFSVLLFIEAYLVRILCLGNDYWALLNLIPVSICFSNFILHNNVVVSKDKRWFFSTLGKSSVVVYVFHILLKDILDLFCFNRFYLYEITTGRFMIILIITIVFSIITVRLSYYKNFKFLKYFY